MNEAKYRRDLIELMRGQGWDAQAHEDMHHNYIADMSFAAHGVDGWIECKYLPKFPTSLKAIPHYTTGQRDWLIKRGSVGAGAVYLLVGTPDHHTMWDWQVLKAVHGLPYPEAAQQAVCNGDTLADVVRYLRGVVQHW